MATRKRGKRTAARRARADPTTRAGGGRASARRDGRALAAPGRVARVRGVLREGGQAMTGRAQHTSNVVIGAGELYIDLLDDDGALTGERYLGDTIGASLSVATETSQVFTGDGPVAEEIHAIARSVTRSFSMILHDMSAENYALFIVGEDADAPVTATAVADESIVVRRGRWYQLGATAANPLGAWAGATLGAMSPVTDDASTPVGDRRGRELGVRRRHGADLHPPGRGEHRRRRHHPGRLHPQGRDGAGGEDRQPQDGARRDPVRRGSGRGRGPAHLRAPVLDRPGRRGGVEERWPGHRAARDAERGDSNLGRGRHAGPAHQREVGLMFRVAAPDTIALTVRVEPPGGGRDSSSSVSGTSASRSVRRICGASPTRTSMMRPSSRTAWSDGPASPTRTGRRFRSRTRRRAARCSIVPTSTTPCATRCSTS